MNELLQKALERRNALRTELVALDTFIASYSVAKDRLRDSPRNYDLFAMPPQLKSRGKGRAAQIRAAMDFSEKVILDAGRPLSRSELLRELEAAGHIIEGGDKSKVLGTNIWRSKRFHNLAGAGYWPRSAELPSQFTAKARRHSMLFDDDR